MSAYSVILPSKQSVNLESCVRTIRAAGEDCRIIVIDNGLEVRRPDCEYIEYTGPFVFSKACNIGISAAGQDDVILLNDDALLKTYLGFRALSHACHSFGYGAMCPGFTHGSVGTINLVNRGRGELREEKVMLVFACVYISRSTIDRVGLLDERFAVNAGGPGARGYGLEDDDYSLRIRQAGLKLAVYDGVLVDHLPESTGLKSTFRHDPDHPHDVRAHEDLFAEKHGHWPELHGFAPGKSRK
jgi:GT2 family glycosyltransferase